MTGPELYLLETRRDRTRGLTQLQGACGPLSPCAYFCVALYTLLYALA